MPISNKHGISLLDQAKAQYNRCMEETVKASEREDCRDMLANAFQAYLAGNRDPRGGRALYGIKVLNVGPNGRPPDGEEVGLEFRFVQGAEYCCTQLECHFRVWDSEGWQSLRQQIHRQGIYIGYPMTIRVRVIVEAGVISGKYVEVATVQVPREVFFEEDV